jgi:hypothetical protein
MDMLALWGLIILLHSDDEHKINGMMRGPL